MRQSKILKAQKAKRTLSEVRRGNKGMKRLRQRSEKAEEERKKANGK